MQQKKIGCCKSFHLKQPYTNTHKSQWFTGGKGIELRRAWGKHIMMSQTKSPKHNHAEEEIITVVSGKLHVVSGDRNLTVEPGDYLIIPSYVPHQAEAMENTSLIEAFGPVRLFKKEKVEQ